LDTSDGSDGDGEGVGVHALAHTETQFEALAGGRPGAFEQYYRDHHARIYNLAARIVGDPDDAADITQEVFLRAYAHPLEDGGDPRPEPWLYRIAVNASYDHLRRRAARPTTSLDAVPEVAEQGDCFAAAETTRLVEGCLAGLTPRYRTALILRDLHGLSTAEIAQVMDLHQGAARVLLHRARSAFRKAFRSAAPTGAGGVSALGLAAFLPDLPVPAQLHSPPVIDIAPPAAGPAAPHAVSPTAGAEQAVLPGGAPAVVPAGGPVAAATAAVSAPAPAGILAGAGGIAGLKVAVAVLATVVVTGGGVAAGHFADTPDVRDVARTAARAAAATSPLARHDPAAWTHREMIRERLQAAGLAPAGDGSGFSGGATVGGGPSGGAQAQGDPVAGGGSGTDAGGGAAVTGGATAGGTGGSDANGGASGSGTTAGGGGSGTPGTGTSASGTSTGGTDAGGGDGTGTNGTGTSETGGGETDSGDGSGDTPTSGGTGSGTGSGGGGS
jgi:RNA polymerase sigma factor (sigma-70 family)